MHAKKLAVLFLAAVSLAPAVVRADDPLRRLEVVFAGGYSAQTRISEAAWRDGRTRNFANANVRFFDNPLTDRVRIITPRRTLLHIQQSDIYYYSGHAGTPSSSNPPMHVLQVRAENDMNAAATVSAADIRGALQGRRGPRLVVINGCKTTNPGDGVQGQNRLSTAFGITAGTTGRAYLGWSDIVIGINGDDQLGRLLAHWTTADAQGNYPTLEQSKRATGNSPNLTIIGDANLRYNVPYLLRSANPRQNNVHPFRMNWELTSATGGRMVIDFGAENAAVLQQLGLPRKLTMAATRTATGFEIRDAQFRQLVERVTEKIADAVTGVFGGQRTTGVQVHEATLQVRSEGDNLRISVRVRATAMVPRNGGAATRQEILNNTVELIGTPETTPRRPRVPA
jgi:hypothetical protein